MNNTSEEIIDGHVDTKLRLFRKEELIAVLKNQK